MTTTVVERLVDGVYDAPYESLPTVVVDAVKRALVDGIACTIGGIGSPAALAAVEVAGGGDGPCTVAGSDLRATPALAALANGAMLRYLDFMDTVLFEGPGGRVSATHPSELLPGILAAAEAGRSSGRELVMAIALAYELTAVLCRRLDGAPLRELGWHHSSLGPYVLPAVAARLTGMSRAQAAGATSLAALNGLALDHVDADGEEPGEARNLAYPLVAAGCLQAVALARAGVHGPPRIAEGRKGFTEVVGRGAWSLEGVVPGAGCEGILESWMKSAVACVLGQAAATAVLELATEHDLSPHTVEEIHLRVHPAALAHMGDEARRHPAEKETADHSLYYLAAVAISDRVIGPEQFSSARLRDRQVALLADRVRLSGADRGGTAAAAVTIRTTGGTWLEHAVERPPGHPQRPFTAGDVERKLRACAAGRLDGARVDRILNLVDRVETLDDAGELARALA
jgi:2-methylcitrate dehydratase